MKRALTGRVLNAWTTKEIDHVHRTRSWIVKFIRANRLLGWMVSEFPLTRVLLLLRHPCAAVASQMAYGFPAQRPQDSKLVADFSQFRPIIESLETEEEFLAAHWALDIAVPFAAPKPRAWRVEAFENLVLQRRTAFSRLLRGWELEPPPDLPESLGAWSITARPDADRQPGVDLLTEWRTLLRPDQVRRILNVVESFGIDFYGDDPMPDESAISR